MDKEEILAEIRRTAKENGGQPLGRGRFEKITSISSWEIGRHWARYSDALVEAGFEPNKFDISGFSDDFLMQSMLNIIKDFGKFPTRGEMRLTRVKDPSFPSDDVYFRRYGGKNNLIKKLMEYCSGKSEYEKQLTILEPLYVVENINSEQGISDNGSSASGFVYLVRGHPGEYKIGRTNLVDRRLSELGATASIEQELVWEIKTDDPAGIEAYWHRRFQEKRMKGEWFRLNPNDVKTFKRWRRIY